jgi:hypothetical protein
MPFSISNFINNSSETVLKSPAIISLMKNPIMTALITTFMILIVILLIFSNQNAKILTLATRASFWIFLVVSGVMFLHNKVLMEECKERDFSGRYEGIITSNLVGNEDQIIPIKIGSFLED